MGSLGVFELNCAMATPFDAAGRIDQARLAAATGRLFDEGVARVVLFGTTGEGASITNGEAIEALDALLATGIPAERVGLGVLRSALGDATALARAGLERGCALALVAPPFFFDVTDEEGLFAWYAALIAGLGGEARDLVLYHIPALTGVKLSLPLTARLADAFPGVVTGVKDSDGDWPFTEALLAAEAHRLAFYIGHEGQLAAGLARGARGTISGLANAFAPEVRAAVEGGDPVAVRRLEQRLASFADVPFVPALKAVLAQRLDDPAWAVPRPPLAALDAAFARDSGAAV